MSHRYCWVWNIKPECIDEYCKLHADPWPSIMEAHSKAGMYDYSIFRNGNQFIYTFNCDRDPEEAFAEVCADPEVIRWNAITSQMIDVDIEGGAVDAAVDYLPEIFRLD